MKTPTVVSSGFRLLWIALSAISLFVLGLIGIVRMCFEGINTETAELILSSVIGWILLIRFARNKHKTEVVMPPKTSDFR